MWGEAIRHSINLFPTWMNIILTMSSLMVIVLALFKGVRRFFPAALTGGNADMLATTIKVTSLSYGFFLGFVMSVLWQAFEKADGLVTQEAGHLSVIVDDASGLDKADGLRVRQAVAQYIQIMRKNEWPAMREGHLSQEAAQALGQIYHVTQSLAPQTESAQFHYASIVSQVRNVYDARMARLALLESPVTDPMRFLIALGFIIDALLISLILSTRNRVHLTLSMLFGFVVAFNIAIATVMDYPFSGDVSVTSKAFEKGNLAALNGLA